MEKNHYQILGVPVTATPAEIAAAHRARRRQLAAHPEAVQRLDQAAAVLLNPAQRQAYDLARRQSALPPMPAAGRSSSGERSSRWGRAFALLGVFAVLAGAGFWFARSKAPLPPTVAPARTAGVAASASAASPAVSGSPAESEAAPLPVAPPGTALPRREPAERPHRPEKRPGFDPGYLAWSVYLVAGAESRGTGVMVERDKIVTNCHVIAGSHKPRSIAAVNSVTQEVFYPEQIAMLSENEDVCLLHVPGAPDYVARWGAAKPLAVGTPTYTVSFPGNEGLRWSAGTLLGRASPSGLPVLLTSNDCRPGVSGGPLFDGEGNVVGITSAGRQYQMRSGEVVRGECVSVEAETAREVMSRALLLLAYAPLRYDGVWKVAR